MHMATKTIKDIDVNGKRVLVRVDFNVPLDGDRITDDTRIEAALPTIRHLLGQGGRVILMSHLGRPKGEPDAAFSLAPVAKRLSELFSRDVVFAKDCIGEDVRDKAAALKAGDIMLLENLRFHKAETIKDKAAKEDTQLREAKDGFAKQIADLADVYVCDAFGTAHRDNASMLTVPQMMEGKPRVAGFLIEKEIEFLGDTIENKTCLVSGSGNVAQYAVQKLLDLGAKPVTMSDSSGFIYDPEGITRERLEWVIELKNVKRGRIREYAQEFGVEYFPDQRPWHVPGDAAFPCATQNEIDLDDAKQLIKNGCRVVAEGANMPTVNDAVEAFIKARVLFGPGKAANAGGVATSGLEMSQNAMRMNWTFEQVDQRLREIMRNIYLATAEAAQRYHEAGNFEVGANIAGFLKVADAMLDQGVV